MPDSQPLRDQSVVTTLITVLWAVHERYPTPHVVRAWSQALEESYGLEEDIEEAKHWMEGFGDDQGWTYWTTHETVPVPDGRPICKPCQDHAGCEPCYCEELSRGRTQGTRGARGSS